MRAFAPWRAAQRAAAIAPARRACAARAAQQDGPAYATRAASITSHDMYYMISARDIVTLMLIIVAPLQDARRA